MLIKNKLRTLNKIFYLGAAGLMMHVIKVQAQNAKWIHSSCARARVCVNMKYEKEKYSENVFLYVICHRFSLSNQFLGNVIHVKCFTWKIIFR